MYISLFFVCFITQSVNYFFLLQQHCGRGRSCRPLPNSGSILFTFNFVYYLSWTHFRKLKDVSLDSVADPECLSDPEFYPSRISDPGSNNSNKREGGKNFGSTFVCSLKYHKTETYFISELDPGSGSATLAIGHIYAHWCWTLRFLCTVPVSDSHVVFDEQNSKVALFFKSDFSMVFVHR